MALLLTPKSQIPQVIRPLKVRRDAKEVEVQNNFDSGWRNLLEFYYGGARHLYISTGLATLGVAPGQLRKPLCNRTFGNHTTQRFLANGALCFQYGTSMISICNNYRFSPSNRNFFQAVTSRISRISASEVMHCR
jgi:hypothetical protein